MSEAVDRYLDLLARALTGDLRRDVPLVREVDWPEHVLADPAVRAFAGGPFSLVETVPLPEEGFLEGRGWHGGLVPPAETMVGLVRLDNVRACIEQVLADDVPGDLIETGVWRGGCAAFMKGVLVAHGDDRRSVVLADSFQGVPPPTDPHDAGIELSELDFLTVTAEQVLATFRRYDLLDHRVELVPGWFRDSLPALRDRTWSLLRLDGDLYESTRDALVNLYDGLSPGGFVIVDDYFAYDACREACEEFRKARGIDDEVMPVDWAGAYWRKRA